MIEIRHRGNGELLLSVEGAMGYYMRFILTDETETRLSTLETALKEADSRYGLANIHTEPFEYAELTYAGELYGELEINRPPDPEELDELREEVEESEASRTKKQAVLTVLGQATAVVAVRVLYQGRSPEATLEKLEPLWEWLFTHRRGLLHADAEGFYDAEGLVLEV
jgi:hypothetical protein